MSSRKMKWMIAGMAALLLIAAGGYIAVDRVMQQKEIAEMEERASLQLFNFNASNVQTLTYDTPEGHFQFDLDGNTWILTDTDYAYTFSANSYYLSTVCSTMCDLAAGKKFETPSGDLAAFGLDDPIVADCFDGFAHNTLYIGSESATKEYYYVMVPGNDTVYGIDYSTGLAMTGQLASLKDPYLINATDVEICGLRLENDGKVVFDVSSDDGIWQLDEPHSISSINGANIKDMITTIVRTEADRFIERRTEDTDMAQYGLDKPISTLFLTKTDGTKRVMDFSKKEGSVYVYFRDTREIAAISTVDFLNTALSDLMNETIYSINAEDTAAVDVKVNDLEFRMELDTANGQYTLDGKDVDALGSDAVSTFLYLFKTMSTLSFEELDMDADPPAPTDAPVIFRYTMLDGSESVVELSEKEENLYYAFVNGTYTGMLVRERSLSGSTGVLSFYEKMNDKLDAQS